MAIELVLMGLRGSGKSTLGEKLAGKYRLRFVDLDRRTPGVLGVRTVAEAWEKYGEGAFRQAEVVALQQAVAEEPEILALGGGTPTAPGAEELVRELKSPSPETWSRVVYLRGSAAVLAERLRQGGVAHRPSLTGRDPIEEIGEVLAARDPLYRALADEVVEIDALDEAAAFRTLDGILGWA